MIILKAGDDGADVRLSGDELDMLNNALNELCNGVHIEDWEFRTRIGWDRATVNKLLDQIHQAAPNAN
jgi:hypothetical protein